MLLLRLDIYFSSWWKKTCLFGVEETVAPWRISIQEVESSGLFIFILFYFSPNESFIQKLINVDYYYFYFFPFIFISWRIITFIFKCIILFIIFQPIYQKS